MKTCIPTNTISPNCKPQDRLETKVHRSLQIDAAHWPIKLWESQMTPRYSAFIARMLNE
jgi:hypothetical protein